MYKRQLLACDASKRTTQHLQDTCRGVIPCAVMPLKGEDLRMLTPKPAAVFAVTDENLSLIHIFFILYSLLFITGKHFFIRK